MCIAAGLKSFVVKGSIEMERQQEATEVYSKESRACWISLLI